jgi:hypothetical protein
MSFDDARDLRRGPAGKAGAVGAGGGLALDDVDGQTACLIQGGVERLLITGKKAWSQYCQADALLLRLGGRGLALKKPEFYARRLRRAVRKMRRAAEVARGLLRDQDGPPATEAGAVVQSLGEVVEQLGPFYNSYDGGCGPLKVPGWTVSGRAATKWTELVQRLLRLRDHLGATLDGLLPYAQARGRGATVRFAVELACDPAYWAGPGRLLNQHLCANDNTIRNHDSRRLQRERSIFAKKAQGSTADLQRKWHDLRHALADAAGGAPEVVRDFLEGVGAQIGDLLEAQSAERYGRRQAGRDVRKTLREALGRLAVLEAGVEPARCALEGRAGPAAALADLMKVCRKATHNVIDFVVAFAIKRKCGGLRFLIAWHKNEAEWLNDTLEPVPGPG